MTVSIIIATYNRADLLDECLSYLARQRFKPGDEVIVVDNGSTDRTAQVIATAATRFAVPLRYVHEATPGKSHALAAALAVALGDVLAFTDDDVDVEVGWLDALREAMRDPRVALVGGAVDPRWAQSPPRWLRTATETYGALAAPLALLDYGAQTIDLGPRAVIGANMAVRREALRQVGGFATHLGKLRGTLLSGEDHDLCRRVQAAGLGAVYAPAMRVRHWVPAERMRVGYYVSWFFWSGITNATLDADDRPARRSVLGVPPYVFRRMATAGCAAAWSALAGNTTRAVERLIDVAYAFGYTARCWGWSVRSTPAPTPAPATGHRS